MKFQMDIKGLPDLEQDTSLEVSRVIRRLVFKIEQRSKILIQTGQKSGKLVKRGKSFHRQSAPGEAPASDTGFLVNSISVMPRNLPQNVTQARVEVAASYGEPLEFKMDRPFIVPAIEWAIQTEMGQL